MVTDHYLVMVTRCLWQIKVPYDLFNHLGCYRNIMQFQISSRRERDIWVIKIRVLRKAFNNFALSDAKDNTSGPLNRGGIADLPLLRTLLAIHQKFQSFWEVMDSIVLLDSFKNPFPTITSLSGLYFRIRIFILLVQMKKSDF